ncbi:MAG: methionine--tRNA ligase [Endozoicomonadaceae bacterium]|nr:methionine--tRNA ligase [Endozoicomonadaceae bacterium]
MTVKRKILVTAALPYANADLHLGHMLEHVQTNIWTRFQKLCGHECISVCGDDAHGTAITLSAEKKGVTPEQLVNQVHQERLQDFHDFHIDFDHYHTTHSEENRELAVQIYQTLKDKGHIISREITQVFDPEKNMFLADRYIKGECPRCKSPDQYGDNCEVCGAVYSATELKNAYSTLSGAQPVSKKSVHFFFQLSDFTAVITQWIQSGAVTEEIANKLKEWLDQGLKDWDISRDGPYFGFELPGETNKYFYVWMDAPVGYMAAFKYLCDRKPNLNFDEYWKPDSRCEVHHFIGKDIINFHCLFWPAMLHGSGFRTPTKVHTHGYLTINGEKMSKSRGTFINVRTYLKHLDPEYLRYYFATKTGPGIQDYDLNMDDFRQRVNSDLVGKLVNIASRCAGFIYKHFNGQLSRENIAPQLTQSFQKKAEYIASCYEKVEIGKAMREIMALADSANVWIDQQKPWVVAKQPGNEIQLQNICTVGIHLFRLLLIYIKPVLPEMVSRAEVFLNIAPLVWNDYKILPAEQTISRFKPLLTRIDAGQIDKMLDENKTSATPTEQPAAKQQGNCWITEQPVAQEIDFTAFTHVDMRVAKVINCSHVEGSDKLLRFEVDLGEEKTRTIFSGIKNAYQPEQLTGKYVIVVANLKPRKMRFGISEGMILCAGGEIPYLVQPDEGAIAGMPVN